MKPVRRKLVAKHGEWFEGEHELVGVSNHFKCHQTHMLKVFLKQINVLVKYAKIGHTALSTLTP